MKYLEKPLNGSKYLEFGVRPEARGRRPTDAGSGDPAYRVGDCFPAGHSRRASRGFGTMVPHATKMSKNVPQPPGRWRTSWPARGDNYGGDGRAVTRKSDVARTGHRALPPRWASVGKTNAETPRTMSIALLGWSVKQVNLPCEGRNNEVLPTNRTNGTNKTTFASPHLCDSLDSRAQASSDN